jgi:signal transduction histidine kinase
MGSDHLARVLSLLSHELRSPLGVIRGYLRLLDGQGEELNEQQRRAIAAALKASDRTSWLLDQVSRLAQLERGDGTLLHPTRTQLQSVLAELDTLVTLPRDPAVGLTIGPPASVELMADAGALRGMLAALVSAAARARTSETTVDVTSSAALHDTRAGVVVTIRAGDAGAPVECDLDVMRGGLGLDLPLAATVIAAHGGTIRELRNGHRTEGFIVWLPILAS